MAHLSLWYLGKLENSTCDKIMAEMSGFEMRDASMGIDGAEKKMTQTIDNSNVKK